MKRISRWIVSAALVYSAAHQANAIATADDVVSLDDPANHGYSLDWNYIYRYKNCTGVAVDSCWLLTAAHVADDAPSGNLVLNGVTYTQLEVVQHPTADLALVRYDLPFPGYYPLHAGEIHNGAKGKKFAYYTLVMAGYGYPGAVEAYGFYESGTPGLKRWGTNRGAGEGVVNINVGGTAGARSTSCFWVQFALGDTTHEAGGNVYDSGGPVFIKVDSVWYLTGILLLRGGYPVPNTNTMAMIHDYIGWIEATIGGTSAPDAMNEESAVDGLLELGTGWYDLSGN